GPLAPYSTGLSYSLVVNPPTIILSPTAMPAAQAGVSYSQTITASAGTAPYSNFTVIPANGLPAGLTLTAGGVLSGMPTAVGTFNFTVPAADSSTGAGAPYTGSQGYALVVNAPAIVLNPSTLTSAQAGVSYSQTISASGGTALYHNFTVSPANGLPAGLTL